LPPTGQVADTGWAALTWTDLGAAVGEDCSIGSQQASMAVARGHLVRGRQLVAFGYLAA
jgi:hypothetical protein